MTLINSIPIQLATLRQKLKTLLSWNRAVSAGLPQVKSFILVCTITAAAVFLKVCLLFLKYDVGHATGCQEYNWIYKHSLKIIQHQDCLCSNFQNIKTELQVWNFKILYVQIS